MNICQQTIRRRDRDRDRETGDQGDLAPPETDDDDDRGECMREETTKNKTADLNHVSKQKTKKNTRTSPLPSVCVMMVHEATAGTMCATVNDRSL